MKHKITLHNNKALIHGVDTAEDVELDATKVWIAFRGNVVGEFTEGSIIAAKVCKYQDIVIAEMEAKI